MSETQFWFNQDKSLCVEMETGKSMTNHELVVKVEELNAEIRHLKNENRKLKNKLENQSLQ